jgi:predicted membrane protein
VLRSTTIEIIAPYVIVAEIMPKLPTPYDPVLAPAVRIVRQLIFMWQSCGSLVIHRLTTKPLVFSSLFVPLLRRVKLRVCLNNPFSLL